MKCIIALLVFAALAIGSDRAFAQATVTENQSSFIYVDANLGSDSNPGTQSRPFKTITAGVNRALSLNESNIGSKIYVNAGTYREWVNIHQTSRQTGATITLQATVPGTAVIAGSDVLSSWQQVSGTEFVHQWQDSVGGCYFPSGWPNIAPIAAHAEMVFINGAPLTQILNSSDRRPGTFYVDSGAQTLHIFPTTGTNPNAARVEVAARRNTLEVNQRNNVVVRGMVMEHAASCPNFQSANVYSSNNILFDKVQAVWNNWGGLGMDHSSNFTVQNSVLSHNGGVGLGTFFSSNGLYQYDETDYNNWRGAMGSFYDFGMGGMKFLHMHGAKLVQHFSYRNQAQGVWFDTDNKNISVTSSSLAENQIANLKLEASQGPVTVQNNSFCSSGSGLLVLNTVGITITGNNFYNNGGTTKWQAGLFLGGNGGRSFNDFQTGQYYNVQTQNTTVLNNTVTNGGAGQNVFATYLSGGPWSTFVNSLRSNQNNWFDPLATTAFLDPGGHHDSLSGWQNVSGQDTSSSWGSVSSAARNCTVPPSSYPDFAINANNRENASAPTQSAPYYMSGGVATIPLQLKSFSYGPVSLSVSGLPSGVSASFSQQSLVSGNSVLTLRASSSAPYTTVPVTIFATSGDRVHSVAVFVAVSH